MLPSANYDLSAYPKHTVPSGKRSPRTSETVGIRSARATGKERGGALIEFTLVMPLLLLLMTGMVSFGFALHNDLLLTNAVSIGAQQLSFSRGQTTDPCATAYTAISAAAPSLTSSLSLTFVINGTTYSATTSCPSGAANMVQGGTLQVTGTYPYTLAIVGQTFGSSHNLKTQISEFIQ
jgi:Flp pilus assembly protein TadG